MDINSAPRSYSASGKLMISAEYVVLDGALSWAVPTVFGQTLHAVPSPGNGIKWTSFNSKNQAWFNGLWNNDGFLVGQDNPDVAETLHRLLARCEELGAHPFEGWNVRTEMDFPNEWGLGSSSSLVALLAKWLNLSPFDIFKDTLTGSGYDLAVAFENSGVLYRLLDGQPKYEVLNHRPNFASQLYFAYSGQKQISSSEVKSYVQISSSKRAQLVRPISDITELMISPTTTYQQFCDAMIEHEEIIGTVLERPTLANKWQNLTGTVKHLGAWGGDFFLLATSDEEDLKRLQHSGVDTIFTWDQLIANCR